MHYSTASISVPEFLFVASLGLILYTYLIYPFAVIGLSKILKNNSLAKKETNNNRRVSILMAVHNEAQVIEKKISALYDSDYPDRLFEVIIGSDCSVDETDSILRNLKSKHPNLKVLFFSERKGKPSIINSLAEIAEGEILIITDANVFPSKDTISKLVSSFDAENIALVDTRLAGTRRKRGGVSISGEAYINLETRIKNAEGKLFGLMMGPSGGFYALKKSYYKNNPENTLADDFRICMNVFEQGGRAISNTDAVVYEDITNSISEEFRRKSRISAGNFQNLVRYSVLFLKPWKKLFIVFFSHKVLRWLSPFILLIMAVSLALLSKHSDLYRWLMVLQLIFIILPPLDLLLKTFKVNIVPLRFITHFALMNIALVNGFFRFLGGVNEGTWKPTRRDN